MKTMKLLLLMLVTSLPVIADNEYSPREVQIGKFDEFSTTFPLDVTKEECSEYFFYSGLASQLIGSTLLTKIEFKGYNPGKEIQRHLKPAPASTSRAAASTECPSGVCTSATEGSTW